MNITIPIFQKQIENIQLSTEMKVLVWLFLIGAIIGFILAKWDARRKGKK